MGKVSHGESNSTPVQALKVAIGVLILVGLFYFLDIKYQVSSLFDLKNIDIVVIGISGLSFCLLWMLLDRWFFGPYIQLFEAREKATVGAEADFKAKEEEAAEILEKYETIILEARTQAMKKKAAVLLDSKNKAQIIIDSAQSEAHKMLDDARKKIADEKSSLGSRAKDEAEALATALVNKVLS